MATSESASMDAEAIRDRIVAAALPHVAFDGWTMKALAAGAVSAGLDRGAARLAFPGGVGQAAGHLSDWADRRMLDRLAALDVEALRVRERIAAGVRARVEVFADHREAARRVLGFLSLPGNAALASRSIFRTVNLLWYAAGDRATDFSFYTKRGLLTAVYTSTVLYWLSDTSEGSEETWAFLDRRIADVMRIPALKARLRAPFDRFARVSGSLTGRGASRRTI